MGNEVMNDFTRDDGLLRTSYDPQHQLLAIESDGGNRHERAGRISSVIRKLRTMGYTLDRYHLSYDEAPGFLPRTTAKYRMYQEEDES